MPSTTSQMTPETQLFVAGPRGLVGSAIWRHVNAHAFENLIGRTSTELDLCDARATADFFAKTCPDVVREAAAAAGGIAANASRPADFFSGNLPIQVNRLDSAVPTELNGSCS